MEEDTRHKIIEAAAASFSDNGYHQTKMDDIARRASVAKGTIYYNFSSKAVLFAEVVVDGIDILIKEVQNKTGKDMTAEEKLKVLIKSTLEIYLKYKNISSILINEVGSGIDKKALAKIEEARSNYRQFIIEILKQGIKTEEFVELPEEVSASALVGLIEGSLKPYFKEDISDINFLLENEIYPLIKKIWFKGLKRR